MRCETAHCVKCKIKFWNVNGGKGYVCEKCNDYYNEVNQKNFIIKDKEEEYYMDDLPLGG